MGYLEFVFWVDKVINSCLTDSQCYCIKQWGHSASEGLWADPGSPTWLPSWRTLLASVTPGSSGFCSGAHVYGFKLTEMPWWYPKFSVTLPPVTAPGDWNIQQERRCPHLQPGLPVAAFKSFALATLVNTSCDHHTHQPLCMLLFMTSFFFILVVFTLSFVFLNVNLVTLAFYCSHMSSLLLL